MPSPTCALARGTRLVAALVLFSSSGVFAQTTRDTLAADSCAAPGREKACGPLSVSMVQLIAMPERFDGKRVKVIGFVHFEFESSAVYLHREDFERSLIANCVWVDLRGEVAKGHAAINNHYVLLEGTFRARQGGIVSGELVDIFSADIWPSRSDTQRPPRGFKVLKATPGAPTTNK